MVIIKIGAAFEAMQCRSKSETSRYRKSLVLAYSLATLLGLIGSTISSPSLAAASEKATDIKIKTLGLQKQVPAILGAGRPVLISIRGKCYKGLYISRISTRTRLYAIGVRPADIVLSVNGTATAGAAELNEAVLKNQAKELKVATARRSGKTIAFLDFGKSERPKDRIPKPPPPPPQPEPASSTEAGNPDEASKLDNNNELTMLEAKMVTLVNSERQKRGLEQLQPSLSLATVAKSHSDDMIRRGYFSHIDPDGKNPGDRAVAAGINASYLAENIASENYREPPLSLMERAHKSLMASQHHRENILRPGLKSIGIGISQDPQKGAMKVTQIFSADLIP